MLADYLGSLWTTATRTGVEHENDLISALDKAEIKGCAMDVFEREPTVPAALLENDRFLGTPHSAGNSIK